MKPTYEALKLENQLCFPLYAASKEVVRLYKPFLDPLGLTYTQYLAMMVLWEYKEITVKEMGRLLYLDSGTLTPLLKKMEADGLLTRERSKDDERNLVVGLSDKGEELKKEAVDVPAKMGKCVNLDGEEALELYRLLYKILGGICRERRQ